MASFTRTSEPRRRDRQGPHLIALARHLLVLAHAAPEFRSGDHSVSPYFGGKNRKGEHVLPKKTHTRFQGMFLNRALFARTSIRKNTDKIVCFFGVKSTAPRLTRGRVLILMLCEANFYGKSCLFHRTNTNGTGNSGSLCVSWKPGRLKLDFAWT